MAKVLITGGAGFIGSHAADALLAAGYDVRVLDNLSPQVHGAQRHRPTYLNKEAELIVGDVTDPLSVERALRGADMVLHLAFQRWRRPEHVRHRLLRQYQRTRHGDLAGSTFQ